MYSFDGGYKHFGGMYYLHLQILSAGNNNSLSLFHKAPNNTMRAEYVMYHIYPTTGHDAFTFNNW
jgi:hypothetical protein